MQEEKKDHGIAHDQCKIKKKNGNKHSKFELSPYAIKQAQQAWQLRSDPLCVPDIQIKNNSSTPNLLKPNNTNDF